MVGGPNAHRSHRAAAERGTVSATSQERRGLSGAVRIEPRVHFPWPFAPRAPWLVRGRARSLVAEMRLSVRFPAKRAVVGGLHPDAAENWSPPVTAMRARAGRAGGCGPTEAGACATRHEVPGPATRAALELRVRRRLSLLPPTARSWRGQSSTDRRARGRTTHESGPPATSVRRPAPR